MHLIGTELRALAGRQATSLTPGNITNTVCTPWDRVSRRRAARDGAGALEDQAGRLHCLSCPIALPVATVANAKTAAAAAAAAASTVRPVLRHGRRRSSHLHERGGQHNTTVARTRCAPAPHSHWPIPGTRRNCACTDQRRLHARARCTDRQAAAMTREESTARHLFPCSCRHANCSRMQFAQTAANLAT
jgi:hypothetical protein